MEIKLIDSKSGKSLGTLSDLSDNSTILDIKEKFQEKESGLYPERQAFRLESRGRILKDNETLSSLGVSNNGKLYFKDLGMQVGWTTVFLVEYAGPLVIFIFFNTRPAVIYGPDAASSHYDLAVRYAAICWNLHYVKRLLETVFVHRFSHATMPILNIFKNSAYYWGFAAFVAYFINHPLYTPPMYGDLQLYGGLVGFLFCELGNLSVHIAFRNLRPEGSKERKIPVPTSNPFTALFSVVSCPNYTYEVGAWACFTVMTQCLPAGLFTLVGFVQMSIWALGKHRNYKKEFKDYPRRRKAILPFIL